MVQGLRYQIWLLVLCCFCINAVIADQHIGRIHRRQDSSGEQSITNAPSRTAEDVSSARITTRPSETNESRTREGEDSSRITRDQSERSSITSQQKSSSTTDLTSTTSSSRLVVTAVPSNINGPADTTSYNTANYNCMSNTQYYHSILKVT